MTTDPARQHASPYMGMGNNPITRVDPDGGEDGEYEMIDGQWTKVSNKGDDIGVDFYHFDRDVGGINYQFTYATTLGSDIYDMSSPTAVIKGGRDLLKGTRRGSDVKAWDIFQEWDGGYGPEFSYFEGSSPITASIRGHYLFKNKFDDFISSGESKGRFPVNWTLFDALKTPFHDVQTQMMGSYILNLYEIGNRTLALATDSKSRTSFYFHLPIHNPPRNNGLIPGKNGWTIPDNRGTNTYQTYLFWND